ncbi:MAG: acetate/propionate family kinase, partial [bacterium]|nr:acetate/propionate family kinase [bacterium]
RKYGFHGISHLYVTEKTAKTMEKSLDELKIITCHLGNGSSMAAVDRGRSVETTMGFTPLDGLLMGTRSGELDPAVIPFVMDAETLEVDEVMKILNKRSGLLGVSGVSNDVREIVEEMQAGNEQTALAMEMFIYRIKKYIGAFAAIMGGVDAITFTGGIGENSVWVRQHACSGLEFLGVMIEEKYNNENRTIISTGKSRVTVLVIPTNEELKIALETAAVIKTEVSRVAEEGTGWDRVCDQL